MARNQTSERRVESVLHLVIGATGHRARDDSPLVSVNGVLRQNGGVFLRRKRTSLDHRVQLVAPTQPARLARPSRQSFRDRRPVTRSAESFDLSTQQIILLRRRGENKTSRNQIVSQSKLSVSLSVSLKNKQNKQTNPIILRTRKAPTASVTIRVREWLGSSAPGVDAADVDAVDARLRRSKPRVATGKR